MKRTRLKPISAKTKARNKEWFKICMKRAEYLIEKYGFIICEYSGEPIFILSTTPNGFDSGWGHHIDRNRNNCTLGNCYIVKYKHHGFIHDNNINVKQEGFEGYELSHKISAQTT